MTVGNRLWISGGGDVEKVKETQKNKDGKGKEREKKTTRQGKL